MDCRAKKKPGLLHGHAAPKLQIQTEKKHHAKKMNCN